MHWKSTLGLVLVLGGVGLAVLSNHIQIEVNDGKVKISVAQRQVSQGKQLFSNDPVTKQFGNAIFSGAQRKIDEGQQEIGQYEQIAGWLQIGAIGCIIVGIVLFFIGRKKR